MKITVNTSSFAQGDSQPLEQLRAKGIVPLINPYKKTMTADQVIEFCAGADGMIAGTEPLTAQVLAQLPSLKVISRCGTGMDNIDLKAAQARGIKIFNTPTAVVAPVAELAVGLMLSLLRRTNIMDRKLHAGVWDKKMGNLLCGKTVGMVGFGRIGQKIAELLLAFGVEILYTDPREIKTSLKSRRINLDGLLKRSDIVSLHLSMEEEGPVMNASQFSLMKKGAWFLNLSRGEAIDENALYTVLKNGHLAGAALDVFNREPYQGPFQNLDNVILTPHIGSYALEARVLMEREAVENLLKGFNII